MSDEKHQESDPVQNLLTANRLHFKMPKQLNVVQSRKLAKISANKQSYTNSQTMEFTLNQGELFADTKNSYLGFTLTSSGITTDLPAGAIGCVRSVVITSESGTEIDRQDDVGLRAFSLQNYLHNPDYFTSMGALEGHEEKDYVGGVGVIIPLQALSGFFDQSALLPGLGVLAGLKIQITFMDPTSVFKSAALINSYTISDPYIMLDTYQLDDGVLRTLNSISQKHGLEMMFKSWDSQSTPVSSTQINVQVNKAMSQAIMAFAKLRLNSDISTTTLNAYKSHTFNTTSFQFQLGSHYFPQLPIVEASVARPIDPFKNALYALDIPLSRNSGMATTLGTFASDHAIHAATLERSSVALSALPIGNARSLIFKASLSAAPVGDGTLTVFTQYTKVLTCFIDRVVVKD